jgi:hypothetical protein
MSEKPRKPIGILIEGDSHSNTFTNIKVVGDMDAVVMRPKDGKAPHSNKFKNLSHINSVSHIPSQEFVSPKKRWFEKLLGLVFLGLVVTVVGGGLVYYLGWQ